jgi:hypothetical protein
MNWYFHFWSKQTKRATLSLIFWDVTPCSPTEVHRNFRGTYGLNILYDLVKRCIKLNISQTRRTQCADAQSCCWIHASSLTQWLNEPRLKYGLVKLCDVAAAQFPCNNMGFSWTESKHSLSNAEINYTFNWEKHIRPWMSGENAP